jgi:16S rRNA (guanine966-N2)-methyltransferase
MRPTRPAKAKDKDHKANDNRAKDKRVQMRVVGGESRGRKLASPVAKGVRPTSDRVRESIFDILASMLPLTDLRVADLFAGTGALGIEALSRGAGSVTFVESDAAAADAIKGNLVSVGLDRPNATVVRREVMNYLGSRPDRFDLALCDPPYGFSDWHELLSVLPAQLAVLESGSEFEVPDSWIVLRSRRYGGTLVKVVRSAGDDPEGDAG